MLLLSLVLVFTFYQATDADWRSVSDASLVGIDSSLISSVSGITSASACQTKCTSTSDIDGNGTPCKSIVYSSTNSVITCTLYGERIGFNNVYLEPSSGVDSSIYYDRPTDNGADTLGDQIETRINDVGYDSFLGYFREGVQGFVNIDDTSTSDLEVLVSTTTDSVENCAKLCLRQRGVIDDSIGTRCDSFNYNNGQCQLLSVSWDSDHSLQNLDSNAWKYYDRLQGDGCWVTQEGCRSNSDMVGTFEVSTDAYGASIEWEYQCMAQAKEYHENVCDGYVSVATTVFWGGTDGQAVFDSWNSWDFSTGCVIDLGGNCDPDGRNNSRFSGKFRDSIAEEQFNAANNVDACFDRAEIWTDYCNLPSDQAINISFPDTGATYIYPLINCTCDEYGMKLDPSSQIEFCTRNNTDIACWRETQQDFWSYNDVICSDLPDGACPEFDSNDWPIATSSYCWLEDFTCTNKPSGNEYDYIGGTFEVPCSSSLSNTYIPFDDITCETFTIDNCENATQIYHDLCGNDEESSNEQAIAYYLVNGNMFVYPPFEDAADVTLMEGIDSLYAYTKSDTSSYGSVGIGTGRWMAVYHGDSKTYNLRQISIWYEHDDTVSLTMSLYKGEGVTGSVKLETVSIGEYGPTESGGEYIHFPIDNVDMDGQSYYTWQVTATDGSQVNGFIGFGLDYSNGYGDLNWDYAFVLWVEDLKTSTDTLLLAESLSKEEGPWFEVYFIVGLFLFVIWLLLLIFFHFKRNHDAKVEKRKERERQQKIKDNARQKALARNDAEAEFYGDDDKNTGLLDTDDEDEDDDNNHYNTNSNLNDRTNMNNKQAIIEEAPEDVEDDDDDVIVTKGQNK